MKAEERTVSKILTEQICYEIPPYQRPYSWKKDNVQQLLDDLWDAYGGGDNEYFIGSLITIERERDSRYEIVDGQQRLTTLSLIFAKLRDSIKDEGVKVELSKRLLPRNVFTGEAETPRLLLRQKDQSFFRKHVLDGQPIPANGRADLDSPQLRLTENLDAIAVFCDGKTEHTLKLFANFLLTKVYVVFVNTDSFASAYRLFNVLNTRGLSLSSSDLIKNTLFSLLGTQAKRSSELEDRWLELEELVGIEQLDVFFSHHRTSVVAAKASKTLHEEIKPLIETAQRGPFGFLDAVIASAGNYVRIQECNFVDPSSLRKIRALQRVQYDEWVPPLLAFLNTPVAAFSETEFISLLERITMQNWVRRLGRSARSTVYYQLINAIKMNKNSDEVREIFYNNANNSEFFELLGGEVYGAPFDHAVMLRLEEAAQDDSVTKTFSGHLTRACFTQDDEGHLLDISLQGG